MGCCVASRQLGDLALRPSEETAIVYQEALLGLSDLQAAKAVAELEKYAVQGVLTSAQVEAWANDLDLDLMTVDSPDSPKVSFLRYFRSPNAGYDEHKLALLLVLLCKGSIWEKADALFRHIPGHNSGSVPSSGIGQVLNTLFDISIEVLPGLAVSQAPVANQSLTSSVYLKYKNRLNDARAIMWRKLYVALVLTNKTVSFQEFSARISQTLDEGDITTSAGVREMMFSLTDGKRVFR